MKIIFLLSALAWLFTTATYPPLLSAPVSSSPEISNAGMPGMWIQNKEMFLGDTLQLRFQAPHAQFLGVIDPEGSFFYLVFTKSGTYTFIFGENLHTDAPAAPITRVEVMYKHMKKTSSVSF